VVHFRHGSQDRREIYRLRSPASGTGDAEEALGTCRAGGTLHRRDGPDHPPRGVCGAGSEGVTEEGKEAVSGGMMARILLREALNSRKGTKKNLKAKRGNLENPA